MPGVARDPGGPLAVALDGDRAGPADGAAPLDRHRTRPRRRGPRAASSAVGRRCASAAARTTRLEIWPSCSYASSGRPGHGRAVRVGLVGRAGDADDVQRGHVAVDPGRRERLPPGLGGRPEVAEDGDHAQPVAGLDQHGGDRRRAAGVAGQRDQAPAGGHEPADLLGALGGDPDDVERGGVPAHPGAGQGDGRDGRVHADGVDAEQVDERGRRCRARAGRPRRGRRPAARRTRRGTRAAAGGAGSARGGVPARRPRARGPGAGVRRGGPRRRPRGPRSVSPSPDHPTAGSPTTSTTTRSA